MRNSFTKGLAKPSSVKIGHRVEHVRASCKVSRTALAAKLGLDRSTVTKWATDGTAPRNLNEVAAALNVDVAAFFAADVTKALEKPTRSRTAPKRAAA